MFESSAFEELFGEEVRVSLEIETLGYSLTEVKEYPNSLRVQPRKVFRIDLGEIRYYYDFLDKLNSVPDFYVSLTSSVANPLFLETSKYFLSYYNRFDRIEDVYNDMSRKGDYGTFIHILIAEFWRSGQINLNEIRDYVEIYKKRKYLEYNTNEWIKRAKRDIIAVSNWQKEHDVNPIAIEICLTARNYGFGSAIDFICEMNYGGGENGRILKKDNNIQRINAIIDWKSGAGFYSSSALQLEGCHLLVKDNFPDLKIDKLLNIRFEGSWREARCIMKEQTLGAGETNVYSKAGRQLSIFEMEWERYKTYHPNFNNPQNFDEVSGYVDIKQDDTFTFNPRNARDIVVEKHRKSLF